MKQKKIKQKTNERMKEKQKRVIANIGSLEGVIRKLNDLEILSCR